MTAISGAQRTSTFGPTLPVEGLCTDFNFVDNSDILSCVGTTKCGQVTSSRKSGAILKCRGTADVVAAVKFARDKTFYR